MSRYVQFGEGNNLTNMSSSQVPTSLHEKFTLLRYFAQYMDENLTEGGEAGKAKAGAGVGGVRTSSPSLAIPQIKRWIRAPKAIIMHLTNGTIQVRSSSSLLSLTRIAASKIKRFTVLQQLSFQVNYFKDHTKLIVGGERQWQVTYINSERQSRSWGLADLARRGASPPVRERLTYVASVLEEFAELDEQASA